MYLRRFEVKVHNRMSKVSLSTCQKCNTDSDGPLQIFLLQSTNPIHTLQIHMGMLEKIKMWISVAAFVFNAIGMIERGRSSNSAKPTRARLPSPSKTQLHNL